MFRCYQLIENRIQDCQAEQAKIFVYISPNESEKKYLTSELRLDEHTLNSSLDPDELSRLEFEPDHVAMIFKRPKSYSAEDRFLFRTTSMGIFLFQEKIIIVVPEDLPMFDDKKFTRTISLKDLMLKMLFRSIFHFLEHLKIINMITDDLEEKINIAMENKYLLNLFTLEKSLVYYLNAINSNSILLQRLKNNVNKISLNQDEEELLDDIMIENSQCFKQADIYANILSSLMDARASIISNNLNVLMKTLNIITISIMVPTFVVSAFSMNVGIPFQRHPLAFWMVLGIALVSLFGFYLFWKYKKW
ncbi:magnesium transporter CorA family protein [candidate division KSB1 bacterium]|nr:magnesium transporter CorA family protein [candidate division KSB1 bacterium]